jgi:hypothetical protein
MATEARSAAKGNAPAPIGCPPGLAIDAGALASPSSEVREVEIAVVIRSQNVVTMSSRELT